MFLTYVVDHPELLAELKPAWPTVAKTIDAHFHRDDWRRMIVVVRLLCGEDPPRAWPQH